MLGKVIDMFKSIKIYNQIISTFLTVIMLGNIKLFSDNFPCLAKSSTCSKVSKFITKLFPRFWQSLCWETLNCLVINFPHFGNVIDMFKSIKIYNQIISTFLTVIMLGNIKLFSDNFPCLAKSSTCSKVSKFITKLFPRFWQSLCWETLNCLVIIFHAWQSHRHVQKYQNF